MLTWPDGLNYDNVAGDVWDSSGTILFRQGDRVRVTGSVVESRGDPPPCYTNTGIRIDRLEAG